MDAVIHDFTLAPVRWVPYVTPIDQAAASPAQRDALKETPSNRKVSAYLLVLANDPESLAERTPLFNEIMYAPGGLSRAERELGALAASVVNHCVYCANVHANRFVELAGQPEVVARIFAAGAGAKLDPRHQVLLDFSVKLSRAPATLDAADLAALRGIGLSDLAVADLVHSVAIFGWANRLMHTLGAPVRPGRSAAA